MSWFVKHNRRAAARHRYEGGDAWIRAEGSLTRECQVIDLSRTGVRLKVANAHSVPNTFTLILTKSCGARPARLRWRIGSEVGAEFIKADTSAASRSTANAPSAKLSASSSTANAPSAKLSASSSAAPAPAPKLSASRSSADTPGANLSAASSSTKPVGADLSPAPRLSSEARQGVKPPLSEDHKTKDLISSLSSRPQAQQPDPKPRASGRKDANNTSSDEAGIEANRRAIPIGGQADRADQTNSKKRVVDLSRLQKKLGPRHAALIDAIKDLDPDSPHGRELALIIASIDESCGRQGNEPN